MLKRYFRNAGIVLAAVTFALFATLAQAQSEQQKLIADSEKVLSNFLRDPDMGWLQQNISRSKALIIAPEILKAGFIFGGSGGRALVVARDPGIRQVGRPGVLCDGDRQRRLPGRDLGV